MEMSQEILEKRQQQVLYDKKWIKFLKRTWIFRHIPFVDFALAAGSMALGNVKPESDFDVIVGARSGRIFTARFFCALAFGIFGWRRAKLSHKESAADKICLNHFVTEKSYQLSGSRNAYWQGLYQNLVPLFGEPEKISKFFTANNAWLSKPRFYADDLRHFYKTASWTKKVREWFLGGAFGDWVEKVLRRIQIARIERSLKTDPPGYKPRIKYNDEELEFHPDTRRIQDFLHYQ